MPDPGFGADGPLGGYPGYDAAIQAMVGMFSINGGPPASQEAAAARLGIPLVDLATGLYAAIAVLMALVERSLSGRGQSIDMTLYDAGIALIIRISPNFLLSGRLPRANRQRPHEHLPVRRLPDENEAALS